MPERAASSTSSEVPSTDSLTARLLGHVGGVEALLRAPQPDVADDGLEHVSIGSLAPELAGVLFLEGPDLAVEEGGEGLAKRRELVGDAEVHEGILPHLGSGCSR
jgi:hypothetical protein